MAGASTGHGVEVVASSLQRFAYSFLRVASGGKAAVRKSRSWGLSLGKRTAKPFAVRRTTSAVARTGSPAPVSRKSAIGVPAAGDAEASAIQAPDRERSPMTPVPSTRPALN